jgi:hypothetical protein
MNEVYENAKVLILENGNEVQKKLFLHLIVSISNLRVVINMNLKIIDRINRIDRVRSDIDIL